MFGWRSYEYKFRDGGFVYLHWWSCLHFKRTSVCKKNNCDAVWRATFVCVKVMHILLFHGCWNHQLYKYLFYLKDISKELEKWRVKFWSNFNISLDMLQRPKLFNASFHLLKLLKYSCGLNGLFKYCFCFYLDYWDIPSINLDYEKTLRLLGLLKLSFTWTIGTLHQ